ncbi:MAG TPA: hypothetical protein VF252_01535 [Gemmatimonadales bacterium]
MGARYLWICLFLAGACSSGDPGDAQPTLVLRCVDGRVDAYIAMAAPADSDSGVGELIPVELDSAPGCEE